MHEVALLGQKQTWPRASRIGDCKLDFTARRTTFFHILMSPPTVDALGASPSRYSFAMDRPGGTFDDKPYNRTKKNGKSSILWKAHLVICNEMKLLNDYGSIANGISNLIGLTKSNFGTTDSIIPRPSEPPSSHLTSHCLFDATF